MSIHKIGSDLIRPFGTKGPSSSSESSGADATEETARVSKSDRVEISQKGRDLAARMDPKTKGLSEGRAAEIRERIASGFYNDPAIAEQVARGVFASGDLEA